MGGLLAWILANYVESMKTKEIHSRRKGVIPFALGCDGLYSDEELKERLSMKGEIGFLHDDIWITDPTMSECGRFSVDPKTYYGVDHE
jgi:fructosamine-3-kinase